MMDRHRQIRDRGEVRATGIGAQQVNPLRAEAAMFADLAPRDFTIHRGQRITRQLKAIARGDLTATAQAMPNHFSS